MSILPCPFQTLSLLSPNMESYMREAFIELFNEDGLTVLGHGLGMPYLFCKFLECYLLQSTSLPKPLVLCINAMDHVPLIHQLLRSTGVAEEALPEVCSLYVRVAAQV